MPVNLPNRAQITYTYGASQNTAISNQTNTTLLDQYTMTVTKTALVTDINTGDSVTYVVRLENTGAGSLYNPTITDDLGTGTAAAAPLSYVVGSAQFYYNGNAVSGTATAVTNGVTFTAATVLAPGDSLIIIYSAVTSASGEVTNTVTAQANGGAVTGDVITATATETINVSIQPAANLTILKSADKDSVVSGDTLTYTFTMINTGDVAADAVNLTDTLPPEFTVNTVSYTADGVTQTIPATDYTIAADNTLTVPAATSALVISVPAATADSPGIVTITVTGTVA